MLNLTTFFANLTSSQPATYAAPTTGGLLNKVWAKFLALTSRKPAAGSYAAMQAMYARK